MSADPTELKVKKEYPTKGIAFCLATLPGTKRVFYGSSDFKVYEIDFAAEKPESKPLEGTGHESYVTGLVRAGKYLVSGSYDGQLIWWDTETKKQIRAVKGHDLWIRNLVVTPDGTRIASVADDMVGKIWDAESGKLLHTLVDHKPETPNHYPSMLYAVAVSADGKLLATGDKVGHIVVWEISTGKKLEEYEAPGLYTWDPTARRHSIGGLRSLAFSADGKFLAAGGIGKIGNVDHLDGPARVEIFDRSQKKHIKMVEDKKLKGLVEKIAFHPSGNWYVIAGGDHNGFVKFYETTSGKMLHEDKAPMHVHDFTLNEGFDSLISAGHGKIALFEFKEVQPVEAQKPVA